MSGAVIAWAQVGTFALGHCRGWTQEVTVLHLTSVLDGVESPLSAPFTVSGSNSLVTSATAPTLVDSASEDVRGSACLSSSECYGVHVRASTLAGVSVLAPTPDGRLFFVENDVQVRVLEGADLIPEPALVLEEREARVVDLALDASSFPENRAVFVAWTEPSRSGGTQLNVTRYRERGHVLAEGVTILTGVPVPPETRPSLAVDRDGYLYVALPPSEPRRSESMTSSRLGDGVVLRLTHDGLVPPTNLLGLPTLASGFSNPMSLTLDPTQRQVWLAGHNSGQIHSIGVVSVSPRHSHAAAVIAHVSSNSPTSLVLLPGEERPDRPQLFVVADDRLQKAQWSDRGALVGYVPLELGEGVRVKRAAATVEGGIYVASDTAILHLVRQ